MKNINYIIHSKVDIKTFKDFSFFHNFILGNRIQGFILSILLLLILGIVNLATGSISLFLLCIVFGIGLPLLNYYIYKRSLDNQIKSNNLATPLEAYTLTLNSTGVTATNQKENATYPWKSLFRIYRTNSYIYVYLIKNKAFIIPFDNIIDTTPDELWTFITDNTNNTKYFKGYKR